MKDYAPTIVQQFALGTDLFEVDPRFYNIKKPSHYEPVQETRTVHALIAETLEERVGDELEEPFFIADMGEVVRQYHRFKTLLARVEPFYAVKCNPDPKMIEILHRLGAGFDCASKTEIQTVMNLGVTAEEIIFANPCKQSSHIKYASSKEVHTMTFDNADELYKIKKINPNAKMVLRILADDSRSVCKFGVKFGASLDIVPYLLQTALNLDLEVIGISFHVGSGCYDAAAFSDAVILARKAFDIAESMGFDFTLLDIGGGFPGYGSNGIQFQDIAALLGPTIDRLFPASIRVIAEPGRYFASSAFTLAVRVSSRRVVSRDEPNAPVSLAGDDHPSFMYYVNDGVYGSFNCVVFDHYHPQPNVLRKDGQLLYGVPNTEIGTEYPCSIWGPTCDSMDNIGKNFSLPSLEIGDWMYFDRMGAYTNAAASTFNGFQKSSIVYTNTELMTKE